MKIKGVIVLSLFSLLLASCGNKKIYESVVTKRIQYDVNIVTPDAEMDWWVQNIEGANREKFVKQLFKQAQDGKVKVYDFFSYKLLTNKEVGAILKTIDTISVERAVPPYDLVDTVIVKEVRMSDIKKIRFLEEWQMDEESLAFTKTVSGICPMVEKLDADGEIRGNKPLFWIFLDKRYPDELLLNK